MPKTRILVLDDHTILRQGLARLLNAEPDLVVRAATGSLGEALLITATGEVDLVLLDIDLGAERGTDFLIQARRNGFRGPVVVLTAGISDEDRATLESHGVTQVLQKDASIDQVAERVRRVADGADVSAVRRPVERDAALSLRAKFTGREANVLRLVVEGLANKEIAAQIGSNEPVVKGILQQLFRKTGTHTRAQLVRAALEQHRGDW